MMTSKARAIPHGGARRTLSPREAAIVRLVGRFRLMTAEQIRAVAFPAQLSKTPLDRALSG